ncbi:MAG: hypothetical protein KJO09_13735 [Gammaproteobacteria bacterium]|nr:hypothetical protein [Gammaproteobacteria bacterium]
MLSTAAGKATTQSKARPRRRDTGSLASRRIWLPKLVYDALPYFYLASGLAAFFATLYITEWFWVLPHYVLFSFVCLHLGVIVYRRRHRKTALLADDTD